MTLTFDRIGLPLDGAETRVRDIISRHFSPDSYKGGQHSPVFVYGDPPEFWKAMRMPLALLRQSRAVSAAAMAAAEAESAAAAVAALREGKYPFMPPHPPNRREMDRARLLRREAEKLAREAWSLVPRRAIIVGLTARTYHTGCPHPKGRANLWFPGPSEESDADVFSLIADEGVSNSDNGREPAVHMDGWQIATLEPLEHVPGEVVDRIGNLIRRAGEWPRKVAVAVKS